MRGGYRIIDFKNTAFTSAVPETISGLFAQVSNPYQKACMVSGLTVGDIKYPEFYAVFIAGSENISAGVVIADQVVTIEVTPEDSVTVTVADQTRTVIQSEEKKTTVKAKK